MILGEGLPLGIIVTVKGNTESIQFYSRFFAPTLGLAEDPVMNLSNFCLNLFLNAKVSFVR